MTLSSKLKNMNMKNTQKNDKLKKKDIANNNNSSFNFRMQSSNNKLAKKTLKSNLDLTKNKRNLTSRNSRNSHNLKGFQSCDSDSLFFDDFMYTPPPTSKKMLNNMPNDINSKNSGIAVLSHENNSDDILDDKKNSNDGRRISKKKNQLINSNNNSHRVRTFRKLTMKSLPNERNETFAKYKSHKSLISSMTPTVQKSVLSNLGIISKKSNAPPRVYQLILLNLK
jgi:hypothetical protein